MTTSLSDDRPEVKLDINVTEHPDAVRIEIVIHGADADARALVQKSVLMAVGLNTDDASIADPATKERVH